MAQRRLVELVLKGKDESKGAFNSLDASIAGSTAASGGLAASLAASTAALKAQIVAMLGLGAASAKTSKGVMGVTIRQQQFGAATAISAKHVLALSVGVAAAAFGMAKAAASLHAFTAEMAVAGDRAAKLSFRLGLTVEGLSELEYIAESGGVPVNQMAMAMQRMTRRMSEAAQGTGEAKDAIKELGINAMELTLLSPDQQFYQIATALQAVTGQSDKLRLAFKLFDSEGVSVLQTLKRDLKEVREEFGKYGGAMSASFAAASEDFTQAHTNLNNATDRLKESLSEPFMAPFTNAINKLAESIELLKALSPGVQGGLLSALPGAPGAFFQGIANGGSGAGAGAGSLPGITDFGIDRKSVV